MRIAKFHRHFLVLGGVIPLLVAAPHAMAQGSADQGTADISATERVEVIAPRIEIHRGHFGETERVTSSREIDMSDSALRTDAGAAELKDRVRSVATDICNDLKESLPHAASSWQACYDDAVTEGLHRADEAIARAHSRQD